MFKNELESPARRISAAPSKSATVSLVGMNKYDHNRALLRMIQDANDLCDRLGH